MEKIKGKHIYEKYNILVIVLGYFFIKYLHVDTYLVNIYYIIYDIY